MKIALEEKAFKKIVKIWTKIEKENKKYIDNMFNEKNKYMLSKCGKKKRK